MDSLRQKLPDSPGVYFFKKGRAILYIGKATSLRDRVRIYFNRRQLAGSRGEFIVSMVNQATSITYRKTDSVLEAIILEALLIKKYQPKFNSKEKDNRSFYYIAVTSDKYSKILMIRGRNLENGQNDLKISKLFGPFPSGQELKEAMRVIRKVFPYLDSCEPNSGKPCFNRQIGLCPGVCTGEISESDYKKQVARIVLFLSGKKKTIINSLKKEMNKRAENLEFEEADKLKRQIFAVEHINDISLIKRESALSSGLSLGQDKIFRIEAYDVAHLSGQNNVGVMIVIENGQIDRNQYRKFKIRGNYPADDLRSLREILERRLNHPEWRFPDMLVVDGGKLQVAVAEEILRRDGMKILVVGVVKDEHHRPKNIIGDPELIKKYDHEILLANHEAHNYAIKYFRKLVNKIK